MDMDPPFRYCRSSWCPHLDSPTLFWYKAQGMEGEICRYSAALDTDEFFQGAEDESWQTDADLDDSVGDSEWFGAMNPVSEWYLWELPSESWLTDTDGGVNEDGSDNEDWSRPPPINTMGLEWFYE